MAPAFIKGFLGIPLSVSSCTKELKAVPEGSTPSRSHIFSPLIGLVDYILSIDKILSISLWIFFLFINWIKNVSLHHVNEKYVI